MITCELKGGLGNQLFQIFTTIAYALHYKVPFYFFNNGPLVGGCTKRFTYWDTFLTSLKPFIKQIKPNYLINESKFEYTLLPFFKNTISMLRGYFQSPKYFDSYKHNIIKLLKINEKKEMLINANNANNTKIDFNNTISLHFRLGDYKQFPDIHPILNENYYINSINYISNNSNVNNSNLKILYFCELNDIEEVKSIIVKIKEQIPNIEFTHNVSINDWQEMLTISLCKYNVMANSTFSWWGSYLNDNNSKIICCPSIWFGLNMSHNTNDLFLDEWIKII